MTGDRDKRQDNSSKKEARITTVKSTSQSKLGQTRQIRKKKERGT